MPRRLTLTDHSTVGSSPAAVAGGPEKKAGGKVGDPKRGGEAGVIARESKRVTRPFLNGVFRSLDPRNGIALSLLEKEPDIKHRERVVAYPVVPRIYS
jgi:hypothetical protein